MIQSATNKAVLFAKASFWTGEMFVDPFASFFTQGMSDFLGLETLRHGTRYTNYIGIRLFGTNQAKGGETGLSCGYSNWVNDRGYFYVWSDSDQKITGIKTGTVTILADSRIVAVMVAVLEFVKKHLGARIFCGLSAAGAIPNEVEIISKINTIPLIETVIFVTFKCGIIISKVVVVALNILFVPNVNFRFKPEEMAEKFEEDPGLVGGCAYRTRYYMGTEHIGFRGVITQGLSGDVWGRMRANPKKVIWGLARLINPIGIVILAGLGVFFAGKAIVSSLSTMPNTVDSRV